MTGRDEFRASQRLQTSENHEYVLDVGSAPATNMRQNQYQVNDRTHTTNTPRQDTHGQHWMSARAMSAHFFTSLHPCLTQSGTYDGVESRGWSDTHSHCSAQFTSLITPNISIERPDAHLADGPTQDVAMANHRPYLRALTHVFHYVRCFIYTRTTGTIVQFYRPTHLLNSAGSSVN